MRLIGLAVALALGLVLAPLFVEAQPEAKVARIGWLGDRPVPIAAPRLEAFFQGLRELGYVDGRNLVIEYRYAEGKPERYPALAAELIARNVDVILAPSTVAAQGAKQATSAVPIVFIGAADPVLDGLVVSLARPGGNVTGLSNLASVLVGKRLELLTQAVPGVRQVAVLWHPGGSGERTEKELLKEAEVAARAVGVRLLFVEARSSADIDGAFSAMTKAHADALTVWGSGMLFGERRRIVDLASKNRLPTVYPVREYVDAGGLLAYGVNLTDLWRRAPTYVDKILKGAKPGNLPVEQPTTFEVVINMKTARALGLTIPQTLLLRADEVVE